MTLTRTFPITKGFLFALILTVAAPLRADDAKAVAESKATFESRGKTIAVERFEPPAPGRYPAVVLLHGSGGVTIGGSMFRDLARELAARGYLVVLPHYFDRTGTVPPAMLPTMVENFPSWAETVADASTYALSLPNAEPGRVALVGFSLGGYLSLSTSTFDPRVTCVVDYFGGLPDQLKDRASKLPPTLILHGEADPIVPVSEARKVQALLESNHVPFEVQTYPGAGHGFFGPAGKDATARTVAFLAKHLKSAPTPAAATASTP
jgi:carboxymethylenebutenolidase